MGVLKDVLASPVKLQKKVQCVRTKAPVRKIYSPTLFGRKKMRCLLHKAAFYSAEHHRYDRARQVKIDYIQLFN